jgi:hypothetical protein
MASLSSTAPLASNLGNPPSQKLTCSNYLFWKAIVMPPQCGAMVLGLLDGSNSTPAKTLEVKNSAKKKTTVPNPAYAAWLARD